MPTAVRAALAVFSLALVVRLGAAVSAGWFLDEVYTWQLSRAPVADVLAHGRLEPIPPGWYLLLEPLSRSTGAPLPLRLPSLLCGAAAVAATLALGRRLFPPAAVGAAVLLAVSYPEWLADSQVRMYGLLGLLNALAFLLWRSSGPRWAWWLVCLLLPLVHYLGLVTLGILTLAPGRRAAPAAGLALGLAWLAFAFSGSQGGGFAPGLPLWAGWSVVTLPAYLLGLTAVPSWPLLRGDAPLPGLPTEVVAGVGGVLGWLALAAGLRTLARRDRAEAFVLGGLTVGPVAALLVGAAAGMQLFQHRYLVPFGFAYMLAFTGGLPARARTAVVAVVAALNLGTAAAFPGDPYLWNQDWRPVADFVRTGEEPEAVVVAHIPYALDGFNQYYAPGAWTVDYSQWGRIPQPRFTEAYRGLPQVRLYGASALAEGLGEFLEGRPVFLIMNQADPVQAPAILAWFQERYEVVQGREIPSLHDWGRILVWKLRPKPQ